MKDPALIGSLPSTEVLQEVILLILRHKHLQPGSSVHVLCERVEVVRIRPNSPLPSRSSAQHFMELSASIHGMVCNPVTRFLSCSGSMEYAVSCGLQSRQSVLCFSLLLGETLSCPILFTCIYFTSSLV